MAGQHSLSYPFSFLSRYLKRHVRSLVYLPFDDFLSLMSSYKKLCNPLFLPLLQVMSSIYEVSEQNSLLARWQDDENSRCTITRTTRPCPGCQVATEKSGGCNHMSCVRCRLEWCWLCLVAWSRNCETDHWFRAA